jgi:hypothetical protein
MYKKYLAFFVTVLSGSLPVHQASACNQDPAQTSATDLQIFNTFGGPNFEIGTGNSIWFANIPTPNFCTFSAAICPQMGGNPFWFVSNNALDEDNHLHMDPNEWGGQGMDLGQSNNPNTPFTKMLNTAFLIYYGLNDNPDHAWHGTEDYVRLILGGDSAWHSDYFRSVTEGNADFNGEFSHNAVGDDEITYTCHVFDNSGGMANSPAYRAGSLVHESWHAWQNANFHVGAVNHFQGPTGSCLIQGDSCDYFYPHTLETFRPFGTLVQESVVQAISWLPAAYTANSEDPNKFHTPYQVQFELLCDFADPATVSGWVTFGTMAIARAEAAEAAQHFINGDPIQCGDNHPFIIL